MLSASFDQRAAHIALALALVTLSGTFAADLRAEGKESCRFPAALSTEAGRLYPGYSVVTQAGLRKGDRSRFRSDHKDACPGLAKLDFYGNGKPTYALALFQRESSKIDVKLVVATQPDDPTKWSIREIDTANLTAVPVMWVEPPQEFKDARGEKRIKAKHPALVFAQYESWAIVYAWNGAEIEKVWVSD